MLLAVLLLVPVFAGGCAKEVVGDPIELTLSYPTGNPVRMASAELIKENLEAIGIKVNLDIMEFATLAEKVYDNVDFELYLMGWRLGADPDASGIWLKDMKWNAVGLDNPKSDELLLQGRGVVDIELRKPIYWEWMEILYDECPYVWLYAGLEAHVYNNRLKEFKPNPFGKYFDLEKWEVTSGKNEIVYAMWSAPDGIFNPNLSESAYDADCHDPIFMGLLNTNPDLSYKPGIASEWDVSDDGLVFSYKLREDVKWHDGKPVTAHDVAFTFLWMCDPDYTGVRADSWMKLRGFDEYRNGYPEKDAQGNVVKDAEGNVVRKKDANGNIVYAEELPGIVVKGDYEIEFHFAEVDAPAHLLVSTWGISPKHVFEGTPIKDLEKHPGVTTNPIGCGPFKFSKYVQGQYFELVKNPDYVYGAPKLDKLIIAIHNRDVAVPSLLNKDIDIAWMQPNADDWAEFKKAPHITIAEYAQNGYQYMGINMRHPFLSNKLVRQALTYAINREAMVEGLLDGMGIVQASHMSSVSWAFNPDIKPYPYNPEKAKELLKKAGYKYNKEGLLVKPTN
jgi:ABC-type transport system substrate-binding protein